MKKVIALVMVCGFALAFASCGGGSKTESTTDSTAMAPADTTAAPADTTKTDSTTMK